MLVDAKFMKFFDENLLFIIQNLSYEYHKTVLTISFCIALYIRRETGIT